MTAIVVGKGGTSKTELVGVGMSPVGKLDDKLETSWASGDDKDIGAEEVEPDKFMPAD